MIKHSETRIIKTARSKAAINEAAGNGYWPLVKPVQPSLEIRSKIKVYQHRVTGEIDTSGDFRGGAIAAEYEAVTDFIQYYPHEVGNPYAAYLIPSDLKPGTHVFLEDLIEDIPNKIWNQGDSRRLESCNATWNGDDFELDDKDLSAADMPWFVG